jgi:hypothetical protein
MVCNCLENSAPTLLIGIGRFSGNLSHGSNETDIYSVKWLIEPSGQMRIGKQTFAITHRSVILIVKYNGLLYLTIFGRIIDILDGQFC